MNNFPLSRTIKNSNYFIFQLLQIRVFSNSVIPVLDTYFATAFRCPLILGVLKAIVKTSLIVQFSLIFLFNFLTSWSTRPVFCKKGVLKNSAKFTGKHLCQSHFFNKVALLKKGYGTGVSLWIFEIFKNTFFIE